MAEGPQRRILLLGADGQLGRELRPLLAPLGQLTSSARAGGELPIDLSDAAALQRSLRRLEPDVIVNAAAFTAVDQAESQRAAAYRINRDVPAELATWAANRGALLLHYSTDYVFGGNGDRPYRESDPTDPQNAYGASKVAGEHEIIAAGCPHLIFRTGWVFGRHGSNFVRTITRLSQTHKEVRVVDDQWGRPVAAASLASLSTQAMLKALQDEVSGLFHLSANGEPVTWFGFAKAFLKWWRSQYPEVHFSEPKPTTTDQYPTPARRPAWSVLDNSRFEAQFGIKVPTWIKQLQLALVDFALPD